MLFFLFFSEIKFLIEQNYSSYNYKYKKTKLKWVVFFLNSFNKIHAFRFSPKDPWTAAF